MEFETTVEKRTEYAASTLVRRKGKEESEEDLPDFLKILLEGVGRPLSRDGLDSIPFWMERDKVARGRAFAVEHLFSLVYSELLSLAILLSLRGSLEVLIYTGKSSTPYDSHQRYLRTVLRVCSWYRSDPWESGSEGRRHLLEVRAMHSSVATEMNAAPLLGATSKVTLEGQKLWCTALEDIRNDLKDSGVETPLEGCPFAAASSLRRGPSPGALYVNQMDLSLTQFGFMGLIVLYPRMFGLGPSSEDDLDAFVHLWRALGHAIGIEDRYNFCSGGLQETRLRCREVIDRWVKPNLLDVTPEWEHMFRCIVEGVRYYVPANSFKAAMAYLLKVLGVSAPRLWASMGWREKILYYAHSFVMRFMLRIPGVFFLYNRSLMASLQRAKHASPERLRELRQKRYQYMGDT